ncbi:hypothetical protein DPMN_006359 [Dreissena polymorpha]|uniref:Uncharacterized protein n=1 Tax=Dreissena polymorpha TaxID=45954 RepID=A0A9D4RXB5_DREPO|nr:hypothetical protein DPMN_006359 [Dreissena polymorpha]
MERKKNKGSQANIQTAKDVYELPRKTCLKPDHLRTIPDGFSCMQTILTELTKPQLRWRKMSRTIGEVYSQDLPKLSRAMTIKNAGP